MESITLTVSHGKNIYKIPLSPTSNVANLKSAIEIQSGIACSLQKLLAKGSLLKDDQPVGNFGEKTKIILMATASTDIAKVAAGALTSIVSPAASATVVVESWADKTVLYNILNLGTF